MVQIPEELRDFAYNSDCWHPLQIASFLASFDKAMGTEAGALLNAIPGIRDNPFIDQKRQEELIIQIKTKAGVLP